MTFRLDLDTTMILEKVTDRDPRLSMLMSAKCEEIIQLAKGHFLVVQRSDNEWRLSETTPPKYIDSFKKVKFRRGFVKGKPGFKWRVVNVDPAAVWVEYGAHAGGKTPVLGYRPLTVALSAVVVI